MASSTVYAGNNFQSVCNRLNGSTLAGGSNQENHLPVGWSSTTDSRWRAIIKFPNISNALPAGAKIVNAKVWIKTTGSTVHVSKGSNARMKISRIIQSENPGFSGGSGEGWYTNANPAGFELSSTGTITYGAEGNPGNGVVKKYDITDFVEFWLPSNYLKRDGNPCSGGVNNGIEIKSYDENSATRTSEFWSTRGGFEPRLVIEYTTEADPSKPTITDPGDFVDLLTAPTTVGVDWAAGTGDEGRLFIGTDFLSTDVYNGSWHAVTPGGHEDIDVSSAAWEVGQPLYIQARSRNDIPVVSSDDVHTITILPVPTATLEWPGAGGRCHIWNLNELAVWTDAGAHAKPRVTVGYTHPTGVASQTVEVRIDGSTVHSFDVAIPSGGTKDLDIDQAMFRATDFTIEVRVQGGGGQWSNWTSPVTARVNFGQALLSFSHASGASGFTTQHASLAGGSAAQVAYAYRAASEAVWAATVGEVTPDTSMDVLVRLSTSDAAQAPSLASLKVNWSEDPAPVPDFWAATNATIELDPAIRRFGVHSLKVVPAGAGWVTNSDLVVVSPNTEYTLSGYVNTLGATLPNDVTLGYLDESGTGVVLTGDDASTDDSTGQGKENWQRLYVTFTTGPDTTLIKPGLYHAGTGQFRMDSWQLESGAVASSWRPGATGPAVILDVGGIAIDGEVGGIFRARGSNGPVVTLGADGLELDGEPYITAADVPEFAPTEPVVRHYTPGSHTWTRPTPAPLYIELEAWGGGGSGGGLLGSTNNGGSASGGGGGGYAKSILSGSDIPASLSMVVGAGGPETAAGQNNGIDGGDTTVTGTGVAITCSAGWGGESSGTAANQTHAGGRGNNGTGGNVENGQGTTGRSGWVWSGYAVEGGSGGASGDGRGGAGGGITWHGGNCADSDWGAGGGGAGNSGKSGVNRTGGAGGPGHVRIIEHYQ